MKKAFKVISVLVLVVVVLVVGAIVAIPMIVNGDDVKAELARQVKAQTGRDLEIPGQVDISVFPWLGARLGEVRFGNAAGFNAPLFAKTDEVELRVKLMPLLERKVEMDTVTVRGLELNLEKLADGRSNWEDLAKGKTAAESGDSAPSDGPGSGDSPIAALAIGGLDISGATLRYSDAGSGESYTVKNFDFKTGTLSPGQAVDLKLGFDLESANPPLTGRVTTDANVAADASGSAVKVSGLSLVADMQGPSLPGGAAKATVAADIDYDGAKQSVSVRNLKVGALDLEASGAVTVSELNATPAVSGELAVAPFNPRALLKALGGSDIKTTDPNALTSVALKTGIAGSPSSLALKPLNVTLDDTTLSGEASVALPQALRFALKLDRIDLDRYVPPGDGGAVATPGAASSKAAELPNETLRGLDIAGTFNAGEVKVSNLKLNDIAAKLDAKKGVIKLAPVSAKLYGGGYAGNVVLDATRDTPRLSLNESLTGVQLSPLLKDLQGEDPISGTANLKAKVTAVGIDADSIMRTLNGDASFTFLDGALKGVNIGKMIRDAKAKIRGGSPSAASEPNRTDFAEITGTANIKDGVVSNPDLAAKSPLLRLSGKGTASLPTQGLDYRAQATVVATSKGQGGKELDDLAGVPIPVHITGTFAEPKYALDLEALAQELAKTKAKELVETQKAKVKEKVEAKIKKKLGDGLGEKAGKLLGGDKGGGGLLNNLLKN